MCVSERGEIKSACVCVREREREIMCVCKRERDSMCVRERVGVRV